jgi:hypothetical protein
MLRCALQHVGAAPVARYGLLKQVGLQHGCGTLIVSGDRLEALQASGWPRSNEAYYQEIPTCSADMLCDETLPITGDTGWSGKALRQRILRSDLREGSR